MLTIFLFSLYTAFFILVITILSLILPRLKSKFGTLSDFIRIALYILNLIFLSYSFGNNIQRKEIITTMAMILGDLLGRKLKVHGITGQICSGKTTMSKYIETNYNAKVINLDNLNREVLLETSVQNKIRKYFGSEVFNSQGELNKTKMRELIFSNDKNRKLLEDITMPRIVFKMLVLIFKEKIIKNTKYVFIEDATMLQYPLLVWLCYPIIAVCATDKVMLVDRVVERDNNTKELAEMILSKQMSAEEFKAKSDIVLLNNGSIENFNKDIQLIMETKV
jgi:dephospho-CoA kinase